MSPLAQAVRLVDREQRDLALGDRGAEACVAEALGRHQHEAAGAVGERREHRLGLARRQGGIEHARRAVPAAASASPWSRISATSGEMTIVRPSSASPGS